MQFAVKVHIQLGQHISRSFLSYLWLTMDILESEGVEVKQKQPNQKKVMNRQELLGCGYIMVFFSAMLYGMWDLVLQDQTQAHGSVSSES